MKNPILFQGEKQLGTNNHYFEGWYFKNTNGKETISFIPGININENEKKAFIQVITNYTSYFISYPIEEFRFNVNPFYLQIRKNIFSPNQMQIDIQDSKQDLSISGKIKYSHHTTIHTNVVNPNIMGPFSYLPFMECNHAILSMQNSIQGEIKLNEKKMKFNQGIGYMEKDWGTSFPKSYIWCQGNDFKKTDASFMLSIADIPLKILEFKGIICVLMIDHKEYKFTTYNHTKLINYQLDEKSLSITLQRGKYQLTVQSIYDNHSKLLAPVKGKMEKTIKESISSTLMVTLKEENNTIFKDTSINCGLEIVE
jgi:hypothetical protein